MQKLLIAVFVLALAAPVFAQQTVNTELPAAAALADNTANPTTPGVAAYLMCYDGSTWDRCTSDTAASWGGAVTFTAGSAPTGSFGFWCRVSASAPSTTGVIDDDVVLPWCTNTGLLQVGVTSMPTTQVQSNSANLATQTSMAAAAASLVNVEAYSQPGSVVRIKSDNTNNDDETQIKATAGVLLAINGFNSSTTTNAYVRCTNATAASTTPGSTTVFFDVMLPFGGGVVQSNLGPGGLTFGTALTCYIATGAADSDATDAAQNEVTVNVVYR